VKNSMCGSFPKKYQNQFVAKKPGEPGFYSVT
jgi:hypothetical protein